MFAVVKTGGKQYRVEKGDTIVVEKLDAKEGTTVDLDVLMVDETLGKGSVKAKIVEQGRSDKKMIFKKKKRQGYRRTKTHRQPETALEITDIKKAG